MPSLEFAGELSYTSRPIVPVRFSNPDSGLAFDTYGLVDSGADLTVVTLDTASLLGFKSGSLPRVTTSGTAGPASALEVEMLVQVFGVAFLASVLVIEQPSVPYNLLGRYPLFRHVHFAFEEYDDPRRNRIL